MQVERSVMERYSQGAQQREEALCCPVDYDSRLLALLPDEIIERVYGCGDPSRHVQTGDTVLDLVSGSGRICYMTAQPHSVRQRFHRTRQPAAAGVAGCRTRLLYP